ncbi:MAG: ParB/RepB/Spo0J family partition protein [Rhodobacteraceae bacterium]|nr:ParB/RepB/Spo0J family partition protein [Paracoccaceae bacterium]
MSKKHDAIFDDVLSGLSPDPTEAPDMPERGGARFLKRSTTLADRLTGEREEKLLHWVDPARCRMWARHNRDYALLTEENCRDLIDGIRAQGQQEFPAIVRRLRGEDAFDYEVICGARRHFAVSWLRANNYPQFRYLVEVRDLSDEEAFRLADIENRDREDISDYERAIDYAHAVEAYYGGRQKAMAERLDVSETWLSRYLQLSRLPKEIVAAYPSVREIRELHARVLKPLLADAAQRERILVTAADLAGQQVAARDGQGAVLDGAAVLARLRAAAAPQTESGPVPPVFRRSTGESGITARRKGKSVQLEFPEGLAPDSLSAAFEHFLRAYGAAGRKCPKP